MQTDMFQTKAPTVVLLDYQCTLVENGHQRGAWMAANRGRPYTEWIAQESMRGWLVAMLKASGAIVVLITARPAKYAALTLDLIAAQCNGWQPDAAYFNEFGEAPPACKRRVLVNSIYATYGADRGAYLALESNGATRAMYKAQGITATPVPQAAGVWANLPTV